MRCLAYQIVVDFGLFERTLQSIFRTLLCADQKPDLISMYHVGE